MDQVPRAFCERVAAYYKCCENVYCRNRCQVGRTTPDCQWTEISKKQFVRLFLTRHNGAWEHEFHSSGWKWTGTMDELRKWPNLKHVVIIEINIVRHQDHYKFKPLNVDITNLMRFVTCFSNEPIFDVYAIPDGTLNSPEGLIFLRGIQEMHFSKIAICDYSSIYNRLLESQYSRRRTTPIEVHAIESGGNFLSRELASLRIQQFKCTMGSGSALSTQVVEEIIDRFMEDPNQFSEEYLLDDYFSSSRRNKLRQELEENELLTHREENENGVTYVFRSRNAPKSLQVEVGVNPWTEIRICQVV